VTLSVGSHPGGLCFVASLEGEGGTCTCRMDSSSCTAEAGVVGLRWFDADTAGSEERYARIAAEIWQLWASSRQAPAQGR